MPVREKMIRRERMPRRKCKTCLVEKGLSHFAIHRTRNDGLRANCRSCENARAIKWYQDNYKGPKGLTKQARDREKRKEWWRQWGKDPSSTYFFEIRAWNARIRAKESRVPFDLNSTFLKDLYAKQGGVCALTGFPLAIKDPLSLNNMSLDRIIPKNGYVKGNVRFVTHQANSAKLFGTDKELLKFCEAVVQKKLAA